MGDWIYWKEEPDERKWKPIPNADTAKQLAIRQGAMFFTWAAFNEQFKGNGQPEPIRCGDLPLDFDSKEDPSRSLQEIRQLCLVHLPELYDIDPYLIRFFASGGKGFGAEIPAEVFGTQSGDPYLHDIYRKMVSTWAADLELTTVDLSMYAGGMGKMWRIPNVKRINGRYKVPLELEEIRDLPFDEIWKMTESPREIEPVEVELIENEGLGELYRNTRDQIYREQAERKESKPLSDEEKEKLSANIPPCITYILTAMPAKSDKINFNKLVMNLITYFQIGGFTKQAAWQKAEYFITNYRHSETYDTADRRVKHWESEWGYLEGQTRYSFSCSYVKGLGLPGNAFDCKRCLAKQGPERQTTAQPKTPPRQTADSGPLQFPCEIMSGAAGDFAKVYADCTEAPVQFYYLSYLTCLGNILAARLTIESQISPQPRLFTLLLGESADDRKSTAIDQTVKFFGQIIEQSSFNVCHGVGSAEGLQKRLEKCNRLVLCFDEFKQFVSKCKIEASVLLPCVTSLFESNKYESRTKSSEICLEGVFLSILAASTVQTYENTWTSQFTDIGFNNRLFLVTGSGKRRFSIPPKVSIENRNHLMYALRGILQQVPTKAELQIEPDAQEAFHNWYMTLESSIHTKRLDTYALRFMPLLAVNDRKQSIDLETVKKVIRLCDWQLEVRKQHDPIDADNAVAKMEEKIRRVMASRGALTERELKQYSNAARAGLWLFEKAKRNLMAAKEIGWKKQDKKYVSL